MRKLFLLITAFSLVSNLGMSQTTRTLKKTLELKMPRTADDDMPGKNGAAVVWHPLQKKYYAAMAGNTDFPLAIFDGAGKRISSEDLNTMFDLRGLWYNPQKKQLCGNGYGENGWFRYMLDAQGTATDVEVDISGMNQPGNQSVETYDPANNEVLFLNGNQVSRYSNVGSVNSQVNLRLGLTRKNNTDEEFVPDSEIPEAYNSTTVIYTGIKGAELGVLNVDKKQIELYDSANGFLTTILKFPETAELNYSFNFSYCNGIYWIFDIEKRTWNGFR